MPIKLVILPLDETHARKQKPSMSVLIIKRTDNYRWPVVMAHVQYIFLIQNRSSNRFSLAAPNQSNYIRRNQPNFWSDHDWMDFFHHVLENVDNVLGSFARLLSYLGENFITTLMIVSNSKKNAIHLFLLLSYPAKQFDRFDILSIMRPNRCVTMRYKAPSRSKDYMNQSRWLNWSDLQSNFEENILLGKN